MGKTQNTGGSNTPVARVVELDANKNWIRQNNILPVFVEAQMTGHKEK